MTPFSVSVSGDDICRHNDAPPRCTRCAFARESRSLNEPKHCQTTESTRDHFHHHTLHPNLFLLCPHFGYQAKRPRATQPFREAISATHTRGNILVVYGLDVLPVDLGLARVRSLPLVRNVADRLLPARPQAHLPQWSENRKLARASVRTRGGPDKDWNLRRNSSVYDEARVATKGGKTKAHPIRVSSKRSSRAQARVREYTRIHTHTHRCLAYIWS